MLYLQLAIQNEKYVIETSKVVEVIPLVQLKHIPKMPNGMAGLCNYRGSPIPVIDLCQLVGDTPSRRFYSSRIILVDYLNSSGDTSVAGLLAERVTEIIELDQLNFITSGVKNKDNYFLAEVITTDKGIVQRIDMGSILENILNIFPFNSEAVQLRM